MLTGTPVRQVRPLLDGGLNVTTDQDTARCDTLVLALDGGPAGRSR
ncbi:hypothetical protein [Streptomyces rubiginosohelvolus]